jgi:ATP-dependent RNA helicase DeaD
VHELKDFKDANLKPQLLEALNSMGFHKMTEVQELSIENLLNHKDLIIRSKTGSGKTGAFLVPIFQNMEHKGHPQAIIIVPTRELALQVNTVAEKLGRACKIRTTTVYGGASMNVQIYNIRNGADMIIGTPGRILDLVDRGALKLDNIRFLVLDEADLMLDMGFIEDIEEIIHTTPKSRQTMLLSATMPREIVGIARKHMKSDVAKLEVGSEETPVVTTITNMYYTASGKGKFAALLAYIEKFQPKKCIIFSSTKHESEFIHTFLVANKFDAILMHGGLTQAKRERSLHEFRQHARFLISTNLASRGLDINDVTDVINFDAPDDVRTYVHRIGRSARMGKDGRAFTLFGHDEKGLMYAIEEYANIKLQQVNLEVEKYKDIQLPQHERRGRFGGGQRDGGGYRGGGGGGYRGGGRGGGGDRRTFHRREDGGNRHGDRTGGGGGGYGGRPRRRQWGNSG